MKILQIGEKPETFYTLALRIRLFANSSWILTWNQSCGRRRSRFRGITACIPEEKCLFFQDDLLNLKPFSAGRLHGCGQPLRFGMFVRRPVIGDASIRVKRFKLSLLTPQFFNPRKPRIVVDGFLECEERGYFVPVPFGWLLALKVGHLFFSHLRFWDFLSVELIEVCPLPSFCLWLVVVLCFPTGMTIVETGPTHYVVQY